MCEKKVVCRILSFKVFNLGYFLFNIILNKILFLCRMYVPTFL